MAERSASDATGRRFPRVKIGRAGSPARHPITLEAAMAAALPVPSRVRSAAGPAGDSLS